MSLQNPPKALLTDVFGTVVDWRSSVVNYLTSTVNETLNSPTASIPSAVRTAAAGIDWGAFAQKWRSGYHKFTKTYGSAGDQPYTNIDTFHYEYLKELIAEHHLEGLWTDTEIHKISLIWHFLDGWPDSAPGLGQLNSKFITCTLSNGNESLLVDLAKHAKLPYKHIISGEHFNAYKPHPDVYNGAAKRLGLQTSECGLIAAHLGDLQAAKSCGYQTIYIDRSHEEAWDKEATQKAREWVDMWVEIDQGGFEEVARRFGVGKAA